jgi:hypothetical protein
MKARQKGFLLVAVPFGVGAVALSLVSMTASVVVTMMGLLAFGFALSRPTGRSLAHSACAFCARKIIFEHQGEFCATCNQAVHAACADEHRMTAHAPAKDQPFR